MTLAVLGYHRIGDPPAEWWSWYYVPMPVFVAQLELVRDLGWDFIDADTLRRGIDDPAVLPPRAAVITFDDACKSLCAEALSTLQERRLPGIVFVPTDYIGGFTDFDEGADPREPVCSWDDLRLLQQAGVSVQSHTVSHPYLSKLDLPTQAEEVRRSKAVLEDGLETQVDLLAYPFGDPGSDPAALAPVLRDAGYRGAFVYGKDNGTVEVPVMDRYRMRRIAVGPETDLSPYLACEE